MAEVTKVDGIFTQTTKNSTVTNPVDKSKQDKEKLNNEIQRELAFKSDRKEAQEQVKKEFLNYGYSDGRDTKSEKEADKAAKNYVKNEYYKERSQGTTVFMDKEAYRAAEKERKEQKKQLVEQYRNEGLSRREARRKANAQLVENEYIKGRKTRTYIEEHRNDFYDENGNFSSDKFKAKAVQFANTHTIEGETENYYLSLKERRKVAQDEGVNANVIKNIAKKSNIGYERDNTNLYRGLAIGAGVAAGVAAGPLFGSSAAAAAASAAAAADSAVAGGSSSSSSSSSAAAASAAASTNGSLIGAGVGAAVGIAAAALIKDKGNKEARVYEPGAKPVQPTAHEPSEPDKPSVPPANDTVVKPIQPVEPEPQPCPEERWQSDFCDHKVRLGDDWTKVTLAKVKSINGKKPDGKVLRAYVHAEKLKHGITDFSLNTMPKVGETMRVYSDFADLLADEKLVKKHPELLLLKDAQIELNCDGQTDGKSSGTPKVKYTKYTGSPTEAVKYKQDCNDNVPVIVK